MSERRGALAGRGIEEASRLVLASLLAVLVLWAMDGMTWSSVWRPLPLVASLALAVANGSAVGVGLAAVWLLLRGILSPLLARPWPPVVSMALGLFGVTLLVLDRTTSTDANALLSPLEHAAHVALTLAIISATAATRSRIALPVAGLALLWLLVFLVHRPTRRGVERYLPGVWDEAVFAPRWVRRVRRVESLRAARIDLSRLSTRYQLDGPLTLNEEWRASPETPSAGSDRGAPPLNVVVFFVDTLRADVAQDPSIMPETVRWTKENIAFERAYATGSSTLLTLIPMLGCRYDSTASRRPSFLSAAQAAGMTTGLAIPREAFDYHRATFPAFRFDRELVVEGRVPVANAVVEQGLQWLRDARPARFLLWLYQHDVHGWGDLPDPIVAQHANEGEFARSDGVHWHYRAAARNVDQSFARLQRGLAELGLLQSTIVVFVSDHGEALGQHADDFWTHSTHLWESLIRVPLVLSVPDRGAASITTSVSTIDLLPTLAPLAGLDLPPAACHGTDLLQPTERRFPILFSAMQEGRLNRVGMLSGAERKLVVDLDSADARLLQVSRDSRSELDVTDARPDEVALRLREILRAPIYQTTD